MTKPQLFRIHYTREGKPRAMTFAKRNAALAELYAVEVLRPLIASIKGTAIQPVQRLAS